MATCDVAVIDESAACCYFVGGENSSWGAYGVVSAFLPWGAYGAVSAQSCVCVDLTCACVLDCQTEDGVGRESGGT